MTDAVIVEAVRTAIGRRNGRLSPVRPDDLLALTLREVVTRAGVDPAQVDDVIAGCVTQTGEQGMNIARAAALIAGFPIEVPGTTINRFCGSGQQAVNFAAQGVLSGAQDVVIGAGVENMSRVPMGADAFGPGEGPVSPKLMDLFEIIPQGNSAEMIAKKWGFSREQLDEFAYQSHVKAGQAIQDRRFQREIFPVQVKQNGTSYEFQIDEGVRIPPSREKMAQLKPSFQEDGVVTAGNSSQISDGAAAVLVTDHHADWTDSGHAEGSQEGRAGTQGHRSLRSQRGFRPGRARLAAGDRRRHGEGQLQRRGDRAGASPRRQRRTLDYDLAA